MYSHCMIIINAVLIIFIMRFEKILINTKCKIKKKTKMCEKKNEKCMKTSKTKKQNTNKNYKGCLLHRCVGASKHTKPNSI